MSRAARRLQPSALAECRKINSRRRIPSCRAIAGSKLHRDILVAIRNPQWRTCNRIWLRGSRRCGSSVSFGFPRPLRRRCRSRRNRSRWLEGGFATALAAFRASVRVYPCGHSSRVGLGLLGNDDAFPLRNPLGVQQLCRTWRFGVELSRRFTFGFLGSVFVEKFSADRYRHLVTGRRVAVGCRANYRDSEKRSDDAVHLPCRPPTSTQSRKR